MGYKKDIEIDRWNLDLELEKQPSTYVEYAIMAVEAELETKEAERKYDLIKAEYERRIRRNPEAFDLPDKPNESLVKGKAESMPKVKRYYKRYMKALGKSKILNKIEKGFQQRKGMLESLAHYDSKMFFAEPNTLRSQRLRDKITSKRIKKELNRKTKKKKLSRRRK